MKMLAIVLSCAFASLCVAQDEANESPRTDLRGHRSDVHDLAFSPDGKLLAATGADGDIRIWDLENEKIVRELRPRVLSANDRTYGIKGERWIESIAYQPSGTYIAEIAVEPDRSRVVRLWTADAADTSKMLDVDANGARSVAFSPDGKRVAYNTRSGEKAIHHIVIRDVESGKVVADLQDNRLAATIVHFSPDGKMLATAGGTKLFVWDLESGKITHEIAGYKKAINGISFSPDGTMLAAAGDEDMARIWRIDDGKKVREFACEQQQVHAISFSRTGKTVATAGKDRTVKLWNPETGRRMKTLLSHAKEALCLAFSPDGKTLATGGKEGSICLWNIDEPAYKDQKDEPKSEKEKKEEEKRKKAKEKEKEKEKPKKPRSP